MTDSKLIKNIVKRIDVETVKEVGKMPLKFWVGVNALVLSWQLPEIINAISELIK